MNATEENRVLSIAVSVMVMLNVLYLSANGLVILLAPAVWYEGSPGVADIGPFNQHFIRDIGIINLFLSVAFGIGLIRPEFRVVLWTAATLWPSARGLPSVGSCRRHLFAIGDPPRFPCCPPARDNRNGTYNLGDPQCTRGKSRIRLSSRGHCVAMSISEPEHQDQCRGAGREASPPRRERDHDAGNAYE
jgi:hypothetical protein